MEGGREGGSKEGRWMDGIEGWMDGEREVGEMGELLNRRVDGWRREGWRDEEMNTVKSCNALP